MPETSSLFNWAPSRLHVDDVVLTDSGPESCARIMCYNLVPVMEAPCSIRTKHAAPRDLEWCDLSANKTLTRTRALSSYT